MPVWGLQIIMGVLPLIGKMIDKWPHGKTRERMKTSINKKRESTQVKIDVQKENIQ